MERDRPLWWMSNQIAALEGTFTLPLPEQTESIETNLRATLMQHIDTGIKNLIVHPETGSGSGSIDSSFGSGISVPVAGHCLNSG